MKKDVMVTVIITAYNHEKYIEQAIQGILDQKTEYEYELVIHERCIYGRNAGYYPRV